ncbi:nicotinate-nucleotide adenylyltransferase [Nonlabens dokdonensis]|uniref:Probable nicotinate-nucleotide adenylyltransferase n=2 Tax=Nonlabens dokdonensis TaxID=328515 RepID=L7W9B8_NONDD|nr:nicotinate (nicotinamide) nucleotide adenylyltransferase [Nonlabens dokdonensis]AGC76787.1 nicotinate mononucleotide adenylyltransferase [Nonlabens dokdonensis DSW-6]PZX44432.1 nicotinate-nucleotide adenylyltransferase [Nonlabens dokdonensis]
MTKKNSIGLYFGTFNPIHIGHLAIANYLVENSDLDEIWMVVTPHNPHKKKKTLLDDYQRLHMVHLATDDYVKIKASNIEFGLPQPSYTVNTLAHLSEKYPDKKFTLIMGEDNLKSLHKWKNYQVILEDYSIIVYPRVSSGDLPEQFINHSKITKIDAPIMEISSTMIRNGIKEGKDLRYFMHHQVQKYVEEMHFYK